MREKTVGMGKLWGVGVCSTVALLAVAFGAAAPEYNPVRTQPVSIGPEAHRLLVAFNSTPGNVVAKSIVSRRQTSGIVVKQARTSAADVTALTHRVGVAMSRSRQITPSMHVLYLPKTLYGADVAATLNALRADPAVKFAEVDERRFPHSATVTPNDPAFVASVTASGTASGQWFMMTPSTATAMSDAAATDAVSAWAITKGSSATVIADIDTGVRFDHPDLLRAGFGGRLLPGYDFVSGDQNPSTGASLGTFLIANDGDGYDPDASDPGDWINSTDQANTTLFPAADCPVGDSSWHGTRVMGILGALTNNNAGIAGMTWNPYLLPVRALGKCGGYDSDIITGMQWAAGMSVTGVPDNPYPADIINLSLGGSGMCPSEYSSVVSTLNGMGVLVVASAGNESGSVDAPANCPGVLAVAGLRNIGTKVGYSSFGSQVGVSAPAGNCVNQSGLCLKSIDTTTNDGSTGPGNNTYTNESNPNIGTSFSAPIVSGVAALMRAVNANLTPAQLILRIQKSASMFPQPSGLPVCPSVATDGSDECACPNDGTQCGAGMVNALSAVNWALRPIAAVSQPNTTGGTQTLDGSGSAASCNRTVTGYAWTTTGGVTIQPGTANTAHVTVAPNGGSGTLTLTVTDSAGATDTATLTIATSGIITKPPTVPTSAGTSAGACPTSLTVTPTPPTISESFSPASVTVNSISSLAISLTNANGFALTQTTFTATLPSSLTMSGGTTSCMGTGSAVATSGNTLSLTGAIIPAGGSCIVTVGVMSATADTYSVPIAAGALVTGPAGANTATATGTLTVTAPLAPTVTEAFNPASVTANSTTTLTITLSNPNAFALTNAMFNEALPSGLTVTGTPSTTCAGAASPLVTGTNVTLSGATLPASGSCTVTVMLQSGAAGDYTSTAPPNSVSSGGASNTTSGMATLTVTAPGKSGGGAVDWWDALFVAGVILAGRRGAKRTSSPAFHGR